MLIDIHTHIFPPHIAEKALHNMKGQLKEHYDTYRIDVEPCGDGTAVDLLKTMNESGCTKSVLCPVVTSEKSTNSINEYSWSQKSERLIPFAGLMPSQEDWRSVLENIAERGFKGIKLHPEYQHFDIDSQRSIEIVKKAEELGLIVIFHTGKDPGYPPPEHSTPEQTANLLDHVSGNKIIAAHMGGLLDWEGVERYLVGSPIYFDTACIAGIMDPELCRHLMLSHGTDKILFGSDFPWKSSKETLDYVRSLGLEKNDLDKICFQNAAKLLEV